MRQFEYTDKQLDALKWLSITSDKTQVLYGGSAGSGKSFLGCDWQIKRRLKYAGTRGAIGRAELKRLRQTTMETFWSLCNAYGLKANKHFVYNGQDHIVKWYNGSQTMLLDLAQSPSDPLFENLGSLELTDYFVDESGEVSERAIEILDSRTRFKLTEFCHHCESSGLNSGIVTEIDSDKRPIKWSCNKCQQESSGIPPKGLLTCNPNKSWLYHSFYDAQRKGTIREDRIFIQALPTDNPHLAKAYLQKLSQLNKIDRERLLEGNWDYDETQDRLYEYDDLLRCFREQPDNKSEELFYLTIDVARLGKDRSVFCIWRGLHLVEIQIYRQKRINELTNIAEQFVSQYNINLSNVLADEDGVGGGLTDNLFCKGFRNGSSPVRENYKNLKADCYFKLAELITENKITFGINNNFKLDIIKELEMVRRYNLDSDGKLQVTPKDKMQFSPDIADAIMMRAYYELRKNYGVYAFA